jgi:uncharacterized membrane protein
MTRIKNTSRKRLNFQIRSSKKIKSEIRRKSKTKLPGKIFICGIRDGML